MTLTKGFIRKNIKVSPQLLFQGVVLWLTYSYILYAFLYMFREAFRIFTGEYGGQILLVLNEQETSLYNLFYAAIATAIGYMFSLSFVLHNLGWKHSRKQRFYIRRVQNDESFNRWAFLLWFFKVTSLLGILYITLPLQFDLDFLKEFPGLMILIPMVVFTSTWPGLRLILGNRSIKWLGVSFLGFVLLSLGLSQKNFMDIELVNHSLRSHSVEYAYNLQVPRSESHQPISNLYLVANFYVVNDSTQTNPINFFNDTYTQVDFDDIEKYILREKDKLDEMDRNRLVMNLHIDQNITMEYIDLLKDEFRKQGIRNIQYSTGLKHSKYHSAHPLFKFSGIPQKLYPWYPEFTVFLDSAENLDLSKYTIRLTESSMYRIKTVQRFNRIEIGADMSQAYLNGKSMPLIEIQSHLEQYLKKYAPDLTIIYSPSHNISYGRYIEVLDLIHVTLDKLRNEFSLQLYGKAYPDLIFANEYDTIRAQYPANILEWTSEEKRLFELLQESKE